MKKKKMIQELMQTTVDDMPYILVPSYRRPDFVFAKNILSRMNKAALEKVFIFVREEQYKSYKHENPNLQYELIPSGAVDGVGSTRNFILEFAIKNRLPVVMDMDDDVKYLQFIYNAKTENSGIVSRHSGVKDWENHPEIPQMVLQLAGKISREVFMKHPEVALGNIRKQRFSNHRDCAEIKYMIDKGPTPRQTKILNVKCCKKNGLFVPDQFNLHGDDIGFAAEVLQRGFHCFNIPCLCYDYVDEKDNSVVRNPKDEESNRWLHALEYEGLKEMEIASYLRETFKFPDGQYKFGDVDWQKYHKLHKSTPIIERW